jgi:16S rRNA (guanine966-N2)-methyltransferase
VRVIAGQFKSRPLKSLAGMDTRPTSDRLRETLFNVLTAGNPAALEGSIWLDIFAGTGAVGIEALSRGAASVTFVENSKAAARLIRQNLNSLGISDGFEIVEQEATKALRRCAAAFDYVFLDPPYRMHGSYEQMLKLLSESAALKVSSIVIAEHDKRFDPGETFGILQRYRTLVQGDSALSSYRHK